jgi:hypothetical protein
MTQAAQSAAASTEVTTVSPGVATVGRGRLTRRMLVAFGCGARGWRYLLRVDSDWRESRGTAPFPLFRWLVAAGLLTWTAIGDPHSLTAWATTHGPWLILAATLALGPQVASISFGWLKMDMLRETREELARVTETLTQLQIQQATAAATASAMVQNIKKQKNVTRTAAAAAEVVTDTAKGQEAKRVPAEDVVNRFLKAPHHGVSLVDESTLEQ